MFNSLSKMFSGERKERRAFPRKKMRFAVVWLNGTEQITGVGTELSQSGCLIALPQQPPTDFDAILDLGRRKIQLRLHTVRGGPFTREGARWFGLGCTFSGIAADDYDSLVRIIKDIPDVDNKAAAELAGMSKTDDAYRMLPLAVQKRVLGTLSQYGRIDIPPDGQAPLLRMEDLGAALDGYGRRLAVHSRVASKDGPQLFDSIITIQPNGNVKLDS
jgi:hypothetical protein